jgi:hypothetical protein
LSRNCCGQNLKKHYLVRWLPATLNEEVVGSEKHGSFVHLRSTSLVCNLQQLVVSSGKMFVFTFIHLKKCDSNHLFVWKSVKLPIKKKNG